MNAPTQRDQVLDILRKKLPDLEKLFKECYLSSGRGAMLVYSRSVIKNGFLNKHDYRTKEDILDVFDDPHSYEILKGMIESYNQKKEGIMAVITDYSNATYFLTVKF